MVYPPLLPLIRTPRAASSRLNWRPSPGRFKWTRPFSRERRNLFSARVPSHFKRSLLLTVVSSVGARHEWHIIEVSLADMNTTSKKDKLVLLVVRGHDSYVALTDVTDVARKWCVSLTCLPHIQHILYIPSMCHSWITNSSTGFLIWNVVYFILELQALKHSCFRKLLSTQRIAASCLVKNSKQLNVFWLLAKRLMKAKHFGSTNRPE